MTALTLSRALHKSVILPAVCATIWLATLLYTCQIQELVVDEYFHVPQIVAFMRGIFVVHPLLTTIPSYHLVMAALMNVFSLQSAQGMRAINATFGLICAFFFYLIRRTLGDPHASLYAAVFFFLPFLYPYYFLIYTDTLSLMLVLGAFFAALKQRHLAAALTLTAALLVRQNNVVWTAFMPLFFSNPHRLRLSEINDTLKKLMHTAWPYALPIAVFFGYWFWHGSISMSKALTTKHPDLSLHLGNLYLFLFLFVLFFPYNAFQGLRQFIDYARHRPWILVILLLIIPLIHLKGSPDNYISIHYYLRNTLIQIVASGPARWAFAAAVAVGVCAIAFTPLALPQSWLIYVFSAFYVCSSWLIENRYLIIPFALWMALCKAESERALWWSLAAWIGVSVFFVWGIFGIRFML